MSIADCSSMQPDLFSSSSKALLSQSSYSSDTGDFMREAKEKLSIYSYDPYSNLYSAENIPSEDEIPFSFGSADSSRHNLLVLMSPTRQNDGEGRVHSDYSTSSSDAGAESSSIGEKRVKRQRRIASFGESTVNIQCGESLEQQDLSSTLTPGEESSTPKEREMPTSNCFGGEDGTTRGKSDLKYESLEEPKKPQRRERRCAVTSYLQSPLATPQRLDWLDSGPLQDDKPANEVEESPEDDDKVTTPTTPRQRKTYSMEDRLFNPLSMLQQTEFSIDAGLGDKSKFRLHLEQDNGEEALPLDRLNEVDFEAESLDSLEVYPNPPASPRLSVHGGEGLFLEDRDLDGVEGSSVSMDYHHQSHGDDNSRPTCGSGFGGGKGGVAGVGGDGDVINSLLTNYPNLAHYPAFSLLAISNFVSRKMSDSAVITRRDRAPPTHPRQRHRCVSDSAAPHIVIDDDKSSEVGSWSHPYCDSGYNDEKSSRGHGSNSSAYIPSPRTSLFSSDLLSQDEGTDGLHYKPHRRLTPYTATCQLKEEGGVFHDEPPSHANATGQTGSSGTMVRPRERSRRSNVKNYSQSSLGASSAGTGASSETISLASLFESQSPLTVEDILSNLGFDDYHSPQLIPDHFIPKEIEHAKPSVMRTLTTSEYLLHDSPSNSHYSSYEPSIASTSYSAPIPYSHLHMTHSHSTASLPGNYTTLCTNTESATVNEAPPTTRTVGGSDLPLGATAENFLAPRSGSPPPTAQAPPEGESQTRNADARFPTTSTMTIGFHRGRLETVPEETASDLSPSPRWLSPRVSIDHSVNFDIAEGKLGASLNVQKVRKRSLPTQREGYKLSVGSLVESDTGGDSIHFSVTSYDDEIAAEREKEREDTLLQLAFEDSTIPQQQQHRRRRRGVYTPPPALLSWLSQQQPIHEEDVGDPDELPWPFNEQARLRKSLTEIQLAQMALGKEESSVAESRYGAMESLCSSGSSKADGCLSISSSPPSSIPRSSPGPVESGTQEGSEETSSKSTTNSLPVRRRHSRDNSIASQQTSHKTRSLSCQSDYHLLRKDLETLPNYNVAGEDGLLRIEIEELRYTMSATQRRLSRALAMKEEQCKQLQEVAVNQT